MALWPDFYPFVLPDAPSAPDPAIDQALVGAAREFYQRTRCWRPWLSFTTSGVTREYALTLPDGTDVERLERATLNGAPLDLLQADNQGVDLASQEGPELGLAAVSSNLGRVLLARVVPAGSAVRVQVSLMPSEAATGISDPDWAQYARGIAAGATARLLLQAGKTWTNPERARECRDEFEGAIARAAWRLHKGATSQVPRRRLRMH